MSVKIKEEEYIYLTAYIRSKEPSLLNSGQIDRMLDAKTPEEAAKVLEECGYGDMSGFKMKELENRLAARRADMMQDLASVAPDRAFVDTFRIKYDYHNAKVIIKAEAVNVNADYLFSRAGRTVPEELAEAYYQDEMNRIPEILAKAMREAKDTLARTGDPQLSDFVLDRAYYEEFASLADATGSEFFVGYVKSAIDCANLRTAVRSMRMGKRPEYLRQVLVPGGNIREDRIIRSAEEKNIESVYSGTELATAAAEGQKVIDGSGITSFERLCDNALNSYLSAAKYDSFSEKPLVAYICAVETEITLVRIILSGKQAGLEADVIRERLRDTYV